MAGPFGFPSLAAWRAEVDLILGNLPRTTARPVHPVVYRMYAADGSLLYVGCTGNFVRRRREHEMRTHWFAEVDRIDTTEFATMAEALRSEALAIKAEHPRFNIRHQAPGRPGLDSDLPTWMIEATADDLAAHERLLVQEVEAHKRSLGDFRHLADRIVRVLHANNADRLADL